MPGGEVRDTAERYGQALVVSIIAIAIAFDLVGSLARILRGTEPLGPVVIRIGLTALLSWLLYRGASGIRWLMAALLGWTGVSMMKGLIALGDWSGGAWALLTVGVYFVVAAAILAASSAVKQFVAAQRLRRGLSPDDAI